MELENLLEAILFWRGEAVTIAELAKATKKSEKEVGEALDQLAARLTGGTRLMRQGNTVALATAPESAETIERLRKEELEGPLGKAGLETLAIVIYHHPVSRADIEYIRGVNSSSILRSLTMRGLIERIENPGDGRSYLYQPMLDLPAALGVARLEDIPDYAAMKEELETVSATHQVNEEVT